MVAVVAPCAPAPRGPPAIPPAWAECRADADCVTVTPSWGCRPCDRAAPDFVTVNRTHWLDARSSFPEPTLRTRVPARECVNQPGCSLVVRCALGRCEAARTLAKSP